MRLEDLVEKAAQYDELLAKDFRDFVHGRKYGLVFEASKPEFVRVWKKEVVRGDLVNILTPRGKVEDTKSEDDESEIVYKVLEVSKNKIRLRDENNGNITEASKSDVVAIARFDKPIYAGLKEVDRIERGGDKPFHVVIDGENYHALQILAYTNQGTVDCIYIDPPYNTGDSDWKYNNNYVGKDDMYRHSKWLTFMEDRLRLAKKLLNPKDSVLIVTIDEKEYLRLGLLLEQLFPEASIQMVSDVIHPSGVARTNQFSRVEEYLFFVAFGDAKPIPTNDSMLDFEMTGNYGTKSGSSITWRRMIRGGSNSLRPRSENCFYPIFVNEKTGKIDSIGYPPGKGVDRNLTPVPKGCVAIWPIHKNGEEGVWQIGRPKLIEALKNGTARLGKRNSAGSWAMNYLSEGMVKEIESGDIIVKGKDENGALILERGSDKQLPAKTVWNKKSHDATQYGSYLINAIHGSKRFVYPKSVYSTHDAIKFYVGNKPNATIVDFFAGSGTTIHAVNLLNAEDDGQRRCICITNNEVSAEEAKQFSKKGLRQSDEEWEKYGIARYATWPRVKACINGVDVKGNPLEGDYGCPFESYQEYEGEVIDPETGKRKTKKLYEKVKTPYYPKLADLKMSDGFEENAIFFELEYLEPSIVSADLAYDNISPVLWLSGGCKGKILSRSEGYAIGETYAVLFNPRQTKKFTSIIKENKKINTVFIVTDSAERYRSLCMEIPDRRVMQLYESYIRSFEINAIG